MLGYIQFVFWLGYIFGYVFFFKSFHYFPVPSSSLVLQSASLLFFLYLKIARWHKRRVRNDIDTPHKWVEDVYMIDTCQQL